MQKPWKKVGEKTVYQNPFWRVDEQRWITPSGNDLDWFVVNKGAFVNIAPFDGERLAFVRVFRPGTGAYSLEFPAGGCDDRDPEVSARAELAEEVGATCETLLSLGSWHVSTGSSTQLMYGYLATHLAETETNRGEGEEGMTVERYTVAEVEEKMLQGEITDMPTVLLFYLLKSRKLI